MSEAGKESHQVIPKICDLCQQVGTQKLCSLYWAWLGDNGRRRAYKQLVCFTCMQTTYAQVIANSQEPVLLCPSCGINTADDYVAVYLTYVVPGFPKASAELPMCGADAVSLKDAALTNARPLEDREASIGGPQSPAPDPDTKRLWDALGLEPARRDG